MNSLLTRVVIPMGAVALVLGFGAEARGELARIAPKPAAADAPPRPDIVVIVTDDEPALDGRLTQHMPNARMLFSVGGLSFTNMHSQLPVCCPARASLLTGQAAHNHRVLEENAKSFDPSMTLATALKGVGYYTALAGKYLNGFENVMTVPPGWDRFAAHAGGGRYYNYDVFDETGTVLHHGSDPDAYSTDAFARLIADAIREAPAGKPLFAMYAPYSPHAPTTPAPRHLNAPCPVPVWKPASWNEADVSDKATWVRALPLLRRPKQLSKQCKTLLSIDDGIDSILSALEAESRTDVLFLYIGDNGMHWGEQRYENHKSSPYVTQVPFYAAWPGRIEPGTSSAFIQNIDLAPTLCELAGCTLGPFANGQAEPNGRSFAPLLLGNPGWVERDAALFEFPIKQKADKGIPPWYAVRSLPSGDLGEWYYIEYATGERELYNASSGPCSSWHGGMNGDPCWLENLHGRPGYEMLEEALSSKLDQLKAE